MDLLHAPVCKWVGAGSSQPHAAFAGQGDHLPAQIENVFAGFLNVPADFGADFDHRLVKLRLGAIHGGQLGPGKNFRLDVGTQVTRFRVDGLVFLFDSDAETGLSHPRTSWLIRFAACPFDEAAEVPPRKALQRYSGASPEGFLAFSMANLATWFTIQSKLAGPTEFISASGAGFIKSMA